MTNQTGYPVIDGILESIAPSTQPERWCECKHALYNHGEDDFSSQKCNVKGCDCKSFTLASANGAEINARLDDLAHDLCYQSIRWSGLYRELSNDQWDALAERLRAQVRTFVEGEIDAELTQIEGEKAND